MTEKKRQIDALHYTPSFDLRNLPTPFRQYLAQAGDLFLSSPKAREEIPILGHVIPGGAWGLLSLAELAVETPANMLGYDMPQGRAQQYFRSNVEQSNELLGVTDPKNILDSVARASPMPLPPAGAFQQLSPAARALAYAVTPGSQARSLPMAMAETAIPAVAEETIRGHLTDDPNYQPIGQWHGRQEATIDVPGPGGMERLPGGGVSIPVPPKDVTLDDVLLHSPIEDYEDITLDRLGDATLDPEIAALLDDDMDERNIAATIAMGAAAALAGVAGVSGVRALHAKRKAASAPADLVGMTERDIGKAAPPATQTTPRELMLRGDSRQSPVTGKGTALKAGFVDRESPVIDLVHRLTTPENARYIEADYRILTTPQAMSSMMKNFMLTGQFPRSDVRTAPLANHLNALADLTPEQLASYKDARIAATRLSDMTREGTAVWGSENAMTLARRVSGVDPTVARLVRESQEYYKGWSDYLRQQGIISPETHAQWRTRNYSPIQQGIQQDDSVLGMLALTDPAARRNPGAHFKARLGLDEGAVKPGHAVDPLTMDMHYAAEVSRLVANNSARRTIVDLIDESGAASWPVGDGKTLMQRLAQKPKDMTDDVITVVRDGKREYWQINDFAIASTLQHSPPATAGVLGTARKFGQELTTGWASPDFAPISVMYEMMVSALAVRTGRALGPIDALGKRTLGHSLSEMGLPSPDVALSPLTGSGKALYGQMLMSAQQRLDMSLRRSDTFTKLLGEDNVRSLRDVMMKSYENSTFGMWERYGGGSAVFYETGGDVTREIPTALRQAAPHFARNLDPSPMGQLRSNALTRSYTNLLGSLHNSVRMQHFGGNVKRGFEIEHMPWTVAGRQIDVPIVRFANKFDEKEMTKLAADTRALTGDPTRVAGSADTQAGRAFQATIDATPYGRHMIQVPAQLVRMAKEHPFRFGTTLAGMGYGAGQAIFTQSAANPSFAHHYWNEMTPEQRARWIPWFGEHDEVQFIVSLDPVMSLVWSPFIEALGTVSGAKSGQLNVSMHDAIANALGAEWSQRDELDVKHGGMAAVGRMGGSPLDNPLVRAGYAGLVGEQMPDYGRFSTQTFGQERDRTDPFSTDDYSVSEHAKLIVEELLMGAGAIAIPTWEAIAAASGYEMPIGDTARDAASAAGTRLREPARAPAMWSLPEVRVSAFNTDARILREKMHAINQLNEFAGGAVFSPEHQVQGDVTRLDPTGRDFAGTEAELVTNMAREASLEYNRATSELNELIRLRDNMKNIPTYTGDPVAMRTRTNEFNRRIMELRQEALTRIQDIEWQVGQMLGDPEFSFEDYDLEAGAQIPLR